MTEEFTINNYLTLKLIDGKTVIFIDGEEFLNCKRLMINIHLEDIQHYDGANSIDDAAEIHGTIFEGKGYEELVQEYSIPPEVEFWGHCSNLQAWADHGYDTRLLHSNLAFSLLKKLADLGDEKAKRVLPLELESRVSSGNAKVIESILIAGLGEYIPVDIINKTWESGNWHLVSLLAKYDFKLPFLTEKKAKDLLEYSNPLERIKILVRLALQGDKIAKRILPLEVESNVSLIKDSNTYYWGLNDDFREYFTEDLIRKLMDDGKWNTIYLLLKNYIELPPINEAQIQDLLAFSKEGVAKELINHFRKKGNKQVEILPSEALSLASSGNPNIVYNLIKLGFRKHITENLAQDFIDKGKWDAIHALSVFLTPLPPLNESQVQDLIEFKDLKKVLWILKEYARKGCETVLKALPKAISSYASSGDLEDIKLINREGLGKYISEEVFQTFIENEKWDIIYELSILRKNPKKHLTRDVLEIFLKNGKWEILLNIEYSPEEKGEVPPLTDELFEVFREKREWKDVISILSRLADHGYKAAKRFLHREVELHAISGDIDVIKTLLEILRYYSDHSLVEKIMHHARKNDIIVLKYKEHVLYVRDREIKELDLECRYLDPPHTHPIEDTTHGMEDITLIEGLGDLCQLEDLNLSRNDIKRIDGLEHLVNLKNLDLESNRISKIEGLEKFVELETLYLHFNRISKIEGLDSQVNLKILSLGSNQITKLVGLEKLVNLKCLSLNNRYQRGNRITKLEGLEKLVNLEKLDLSNNQITRIEGLDKLVNLKELSLSNNQITRIEGLDKLVNLEKLDLSNNQIARIEGLDKLVELKELHLPNNQITKIESLDKLVNLEKLNLSNNHITKIEGLDNIPYHYEVSLDNNPINESELESYWEKRYQREKKNHPERYYY